MHLNYSAMAATAVLVMVDWPAVADRLRPAPAARGESVPPTPRGAAAETTRPVGKEQGR
jgi:hypothetical protein